MSVTPNEVLETLWAVYVVSAKHGAAPVSRHTLRDEGLRVFRSESLRLKGSATHAVEFRRETWRGSELVAWEVA